MSFNALITAEPLEGEETRLRQKPKVDKVVSPEVIKKGSIIVIIGIVAYETVKWTAAIVAAPETGGLSIGAAAATP